MEGRSIPLHSRRCIHGSLKSNYAFNSVLIIELAKICRYYLLPRASKSAVVPLNHLKLHMLSQVHGTGPQVCGLIVDKFLQRKTLYFIAI